MLGWFCPRHGLWLSINIIGHVTTLAPAHWRLHTPLSSIARFHLLQTNYLVYQWVSRYRDCIGENIVCSTMDVKCFSHCWTNVFIHDKHQFLNWSCGIHFTLSRNVDITRVFLFIVRQIYYRLLGRKFFLLVYALLFGKTTFKNRKLFQITRRSLVEIGVRKKYLILNVA